MHRALVALLAGPVVACYTGLPTDRAARVCVVDADCGDGTCTNEVCEPPPGSGNTSSSSVGGSSGGSSSDEPGTSGGATSTTSSGNGNSTTSSSTTSTSSTGDPGGGASSSGDGSSGGGMTTDPTTDGGTTGPEECDPNDPSMQTVAGPGDRAGDPCCTTDDSCTGRDVMGQPPQESDVGHQLECVNGVWTVDDTECTEKCETGGTGYLGCFWDSYYGLASPLCGCR